MPNFPPREKRLSNAQRQEATTVDKGHGRRERRTLVCSTELNGYLDWPFAAQAFKLTRRRTYRGQTSIETSYGITSLHRDKAGARDLLDLVRSHWGIENSVFHVRDVALGEDHCRVRKNDAPHILSYLRNTILNLFRLSGITRITSALRRYSALPLDALALLKCQN